MTVAAVIAVIAALAAIAALAGSVAALRRTRAATGSLEREIERGRTRFAAIVAEEVEERSAELERQLARSRAESLSALAAEERRIAEERRRDVIERERNAGAKLSEALTEAQRDVDRRLRDWASDIDKLQAHLAAEQERLGQRQRQLTAGIESRLEEETQRLQVAIDDYRALLARAREEIERMTKSLVDESAAELEQHGAERRRALQEVADRLKRREAELQEVIDHEQAEAMQRVALALGEVETRQVEQLRRTVSKEATRYAEAAAVQFDTTIKTAREEAARRLRRELDLAVERFAREADGVLAERVESVARGAVQQVELRLESLFDAVERHRDETLDSFESRVQEIEAGLRARLAEIAAEAEAERELIDRRLHDLARRLEELSARR
jgi:hypothetical protein